MGYATLNGNRIVRGSITTPLYGAWSGDVLLAEPAAIPTPSLLAFGNLALTGTAYRTGAFAGSQWARLVAGYGGWRKPLPARQYIRAQGINASTVLRDAAAEVGEQVVIAEDYVIGQQYVRPGPSSADPAPACRVLRQLGGDLWWIDGAGVTQVGPRPTLVIVSPFTVVDWDAGLGKFQIATEDLASWLPGNTFSAPTVPTTQTISSATLAVDDRGVLRLEVLSE